MYLLSPEFHSDLSQLLGGPGRLRYLVQPLVAVAIGFRDGRLDASAGATPYFLEFLSASGRRKTVLLSGFNSIATPFIVAILMDMIMQFMVLHQVRFMSAVATGVFLIAIPYLLTRGFTNRITTRRHHSRTEFADDLK